MRFHRGPLIGTSTEDRAVLAHVLEMQPAGTAIEFGVGHGFTLAMIANQMPVIGFGNETGLPEDWRTEFPAGSLAYPAPNVPGAQVVVGDFIDTLPGFEWPDHVGLIHFDADLYSSTAIALSHLPKMAGGTFVVFDEWFGYDGCEDHEQRAWREYADATGVDWDVIGHGREQWAIRIKETA